MTGNNGGNSNIENPGSDQSTKTERKLIDKASFLFFYDNLVNGLGKCKFGDIIKGNTLLASVILRNALSELCS